MSWAGNGKTTIRSLRELRAEGSTGPLTIYPQSGYGEAASKVVIESVLVAVGALVAQLGTDDAEVQVTISGHANPGHEPEAGWARDEIRILIQRT